MSPKPLFSAFILASLLLGCGGIKVSTDYDSTANFSALKSYSWIPKNEAANGAGTASDDLIDKRVVDAIDADLASKGFTKVDSGGDFAVGYQLTTQDDVSYQTINTGWGGGWGYGGWYGGGGMGSSTTQAIHTTVGTLYIAMFDTSSQKLLWRGSGQGDVKQSVSPEERTKRVNAAVTKILESFPPPTK